MIQPELCIKGALKLDNSFILAVGPTDCIVEGEVLKLGGPFLQTWQKKHLKLYPNRLEFYHKSRDGQVVKGKGVEVSRGGRGRGEAEGLR